MNKKNQWKIFHYLDGPGSILAAWPAAGCRPTKEPAAQPGSTRAKTEAPAEKTKLAMIQFLGSPVHRRDGQASRKAMTWL
jgi:hypothetical protein